MPDAERRRAGDKVEPDENVAERRAKKTANRRDVKTAVRSVKRDRERRVDDGERREPGAAGALERKREPASPIKNVQNESDREKSDVRDKRRVG